MPKIFAVRGDGWAWELLKDATQQPTIAALLRNFGGHISNGALSKDRWTYLAPPPLYPLHKPTPEEKDPEAWLTLIPVTVGPILTRFDCRVMVKMDIYAVAG